MTTITEQLNILQRNFLDKTDLSTSDFCDWDMED